MKNENKEILKEVYEALDKLEELKATLRPIENTFDEFQEKYCKGINYVPIYASNLNGAVYKFTKEARECRKSL